MKTQYSNEDLWTFKGNSIDDLKLEGDFIGFFRSYRLLSTSDSVKLNEKISWWTFRQTKLEKTLEIPSNVYLKRYQAKAIYSKIKLKYLSVSVPQSPTYHTIMIISPGPIKMSKHILGAYIWVAYTWRGEVIIVRNFVVVQKNYSKEKKGVIFFIQNVFKTMYNSFRQFYFTGCKYFYCFFYN